MPNSNSSPSETYTNPILPGGFPDPSICRVGEDYYLVNSSFEYFPGLPIHHSRDLINWELIGYGLDRIEVVSGRNNLVDVQSQGGIHAPTIRHHNGLFHIITTNVYLPPGENPEVQFINFVMTAADPAGPWSDPVIVEGAPGIDPDIFFDEDGTVWYVGTHSPPDPNFDGEGEIWLQKLNPETWQLVGERFFLWRGACGGLWVEGPHLYRRDGRYYLLVAEGGTSFDHAVMIAVSDHITGPYQSNPRNPIITSRHLSYDNWVHSTGHADLVELADGRWMMVLLGIRGDDERGSNMGRETHLIPVVWEREPYEWKVTRPEWPVCAPESGRVDRTLSIPFENSPQDQLEQFVDTFDSPTLGLIWNSRRVPLDGLYSLTERPGALRLYTRPETIHPRGRAPWIGFRQTESDFEFRVEMAFRPDQDGEEAGLILFQKEDRYFTVTLRREDGALVLVARLGSAELGRRDIPAHADLSLELAAFDGRYQVGFVIDGGQVLGSLELASAELDLRSYGYTGAYLGLYATSNGAQSGAYADFTRVDYRPHRRD